MQSGRTERTVLVLGAGASKIYGFPLGHELKQMILASLQSSFAQGTSLPGFSLDLLKEFHEVFRCSALPTIDQFLEKKPKFRDLGAFLIARVMLPLEKRERLFPHSDWYAYLFESLNFDNDEPDTSYLSIVTLNYERSLEEFLTRNIDYNCREDRVEHAHEKRKHLRIVHAHGSLGAHPEVPYGGGANAELVAQAVVKAAKNIKIMSDNLEDSTEFRAAQTLIAEAERAVFLGFGYHERVLKGLFAKAKVSNMLMCGSALGVSKALYEPAFAALGKRFDIETSNGDANAFIRRVPLIRQVPPGAIALGLPR